MELPSAWELGGHLANMVLVESRIHSHSEAGNAAAPVGEEQVRLVGSPELGEGILERIRRRERERQQHRTKQREFKDKQDQYMRLMVYATPSMVQEPRPNGDAPITW